MQYMLKYDSTHGRFEGDISGSADEFVVNGKTVAMHACMNAADIPWATSGADFVVESTGVYTTLEKVCTCIGAAKMLDYILTAAIDGMLFLCRLLHT